MDTIDTRATRTRRNRNGHEVRTTMTNAGSLRTGDVLAQSFAGLGVTVLDSDGTAITIRTYSLQTGDTRTVSYPVTHMVEIVHPAHRGRELPHTAY